MPSRKQKRIMLPSLVMDGAMKPTMISGTQ